MCVLMHTMWQSPISRSWRVYACNQEPLAQLCCCLLRACGVWQVFTAISDELRAKSNVELEKSGIHK